MKDPVATPSVPVKDSPDPMAVDAFFETVPLLQQRYVAVTLKRTQAGNIVVFPPIQLYCPTEKCKRVGSFDQFVDDDDVYVTYASDGRSYRSEFVIYGCRNCQNSFKTYALKMAFTEDPVTSRFMKIGEVPRFGEPRPDMVTDVLKDELEYFERGYRSEREGLGIGAFAYYRRFVDSHKDKIIEKIRAVAVAQGAGDEIIAALDRAQGTNSFERAVTAIKDAIPPVLRLKGGINPLTLLYTALSIGVHEDDDVVCLEQAQDIRRVLTALAERTNQALADSNDLDESVKRLLSRGKTVKPSKS